MRFTVVDEAKDTPTWYMHCESVGPPPLTYAHVAVTLFPLSHSTILNRMEKFSHFMDSFPCGMLMVICPHLLASDVCGCDVRVWV
jgi:hypothetical protein